MQLDGGGYLQHAGVVLAGHAAPIESHAGIHVLRFLQRKQLVEYAAQQRRQVNRHTHEGAGHWHLPMAYTSADKVYAFC